MKHLIIAGTNKAATTSLFNYLNDHPDICGSYIKQTNYFLDKNVQQQYNLDSIYNYDDKHNSYQNYFKCKKTQKFKLEASPDYMFYEESATKIKKFLDNNDGHVIFILRNPVTRFVSWFNFGKQMEMLDKNQNLESFYNESKKYRDNKNLAKMAFQTGFYSNYLKYYFKKIQHKKLHIFFYEDLIEKPEKFMKLFCTQLKIDASFYNSYNFKQFNKTVSIKSKTVQSIYNSLREFYLNKMFKGKIGVFFGVFFKNTIGVFVKKINTSKVKKNVDEITINKIKQSYKAEIINLKEFYTATIPWES